MEPEHFDIVKKILQTHLEGTASVYVFGSRAKQSAYRYSDLDLAIDYHQQPLPMPIDVKLSVAFDESLLPFKVDIVDAAGLATDFRKSIESDWVKIL